MRGPVRRAPTRIPAAAVVVSILVGACGGLSDEGFPSGDAGDQLRELHERWATTPAKISYELETEDAGTVLDGTVTLAWRPPGASRLDLDVAGINTIIVQADDEAYYCGGTLPEPSCIRMEFPELPDVAGQAPFTGLLTDADALAEDIDRRTAGSRVHTSTGTVAGEEVRCYWPDPGTGTGLGSAEWCFAQDGALLRFVAVGMGLEGADSFRLEATSVDREVADEDLEAPYPSVDVPVIPIPGM